MVEQTLPGYLSWFGVEQILWLCSTVMNFLYTIVPSVGWAIVLYAVFSHALLFPFSLKNGLDRRNSAKKAEKLQALKQEFSSLSDEERSRDDVKRQYQVKEKEIKGKNSFGLGCLVILLRMFVLIAAMPIISLMDTPGAPFFVENVNGAYNFMGINLLYTPWSENGLQLTWALLFPIFAAAIISIPSLLSTRKNLRAQKELREQKTKEEREEEEKLLKEMGLKENKIPVGYIIQCVFAVLYFYTFSHLKISLTLFWCAYYTMGIAVNKLIDVVIARVANNIR